MRVCERDVYEFVRLSGQNDIKHCSFRILLKAAHVICEVDLRLDHSQSQDEVAVLCTHLIRGISVCADTTLISVDLSLHAIHVV